MEFVTEGDNKKMANNVWELYQQDKILNLTDARETSFEWNRIKKKVMAKNGVIIGHVYRHYVPYKAIRKDLEETLVGHTRAFACEFLATSIKDLYSKSQVFTIAKLEPPPPPPYDHTSVEDSLSATWRSQTRAASNAWVSWALEAICDYPDNIYYGSGSGDGAGTLVDLPKSGTQLERVKKGAANLRSAIGATELKKLVDAGGEKM